MNYKKLALVGFISAFVAFLTSIMGVAGTIIGSVITSVLYNMLTEALENPVNKATFSADFEWDIAYVFPLVVIALIQLLLIFALLADVGILPNTFLNAYLSLQSLANNNLYRLLGIALLVISAYPLVLKPDFVKKEHGGIIAAVGLVFLARGFVDLGNSVTDIYDDVFIHFDLPIAIIAFVLLVIVIVRILILSRRSQKESEVDEHSVNEENFSQENIHKVHHSTKHKDFDYNKKRKPGSVSNTKKADKPKDAPQKTHSVKFDNHVDSEKPAKGINKSSGNIHFESNDLLDDYKK
jgi:ABC-type multidrug transport system fused ATPase/permease subunit